MNNIYFKVNEPNVVYEIFDKEVVLVNFGTSCYYNLSNSGVDIWSLIVDGADKITIINELIFKYNSNESLISETVSNQLEELLREGLIVTSDEGDSEYVSKYVAQSEKEKFVKPLLEKFSDMEELLLLDPIHEVEESGWPNKKI